jgi:hypothetical protein
MQKRNWMTWILLGLAAFFILSLLTIPFAGWGHAGGWEMMRPGIEAHKTVDGFARGAGGFSPFGLLFGLVGMLFRIALFALLLFAGIVLWQKLSGSGNTANDLANDLTSRISSLFTRATCPQCGQPVQSHWQHCPHCGQPLAPTVDKGAPPPAENINV